MSARDYSLLRPFDLEAAKLGEAMIDADGDAVEYVAGPGDGGDMCVAVNGNYMLARVGDLRMAPLAWVEGKPVYKGDRPWNKIDGKQYTVTRFCKSTEVLQTVEERSDGVRAICIEDATWTPPKVKRTVKMLAWFDGAALMWRSEEVQLPPRWIRAPSEDKEIEIEEPAEVAK